VKEKEGKTHKKEEEKRNFVNTLSLSLSHSLAAQ
jgi:hypothetical protein